MKTATWIFGALAALFAVTVDADGVCYDPDRNGNGRNVAGDMAQIRAKGFSHVRTYISAGIADGVAASGLRSMLGIPVENRGENMEPHLAAAERAVKTGTVDYIMVGNENLVDQEWVSEDFLKVIRSVKARFPNVRVGTVQRSTEIIHLKNLDALLAACDVIGVNIHPFFTNLATVRKSAIEETMAQWNACKGRMNGKPLILTETGWPSSGSTAGNSGSIESAQSYWNSYKSSGVYGQLADSDKYYFQFFDTPKKGPEFERTYGLFTDVGKEKLNGVGGVPAPAPTPAPTTPAPTTPAPTTPEPTTVSPASNSTSGSGDNESGLVAGLGSASAGSDATEVGQEESADLGIATDTDATTGSTQAPTDDGTTETGGNANDDAKEANTKASSEGSSTGLVVVIMLGVAAVGGAFAFIYKARQKAAEMERSESKSFDVSITPGGACVL